jgi:hypothetical protein
MVSTAQDIMRRYGIDQDFASSIESLGNDLGVDPMYLANTMYAESTLNPSEKNKAGSKAMGLIQFMPKTAANLGTTTDELSRMTPVEQMEYVRRYFSADNLGAGRLRALRNDPSQHNVNMAVFLPSMIGKPVDTQIPQKYWRQNGSIRTPADYTRSAEERVNAYIQSNPADTQADTVDAQTDQMLSKEQPGGTFRPEDESVPSDTVAVTSDQVEEEPGFLDTVGEYVGDAYDTVSEYAGETVDTLEGVAESVGEKLRRLLGSEEEQSNTSVDNPPIPEPRPERRPVAVDNPPIPEPRPKQAVVDFSDVVDFVGTLKKAEGGSVEKKAEFIKKDDDDDVPDPPPGATPEEVADDIPAYLSTGEYVLPANVVRYIGLKNITGMHQRALAELQQMEDLDIIENVDENGYVEEDDDEMDYMEPEEAGVVEIVVAEHHPKGLMAMGFAEGGMINSDSSMEEGQVLPTSDIFSEGVYAQVNIDRSVDSENAVESDKVITAPVAFSSAPGKTAYLAYITPEEAASLRQAKQGFSSEGNGQEVSDGQYQHLGPKGLMSFNGQGGGTGAGAAPGGKGGGGYGPGDPDSTARSGGRPGGTGPGPGVGAAPGGRPGRGGYGPGDPDSTARSGGRPGGGTPSSDVGVGGGFGTKAEIDRTLEKIVKAVTRVSLLEQVEEDFAKVNQKARAAGISVTDGRGYSGPAGSPPGPAFGGGDEGNDVGGSQEFPEEEKADTDSTKTTDTDPLSDYIYVPGVGYRRKIRSVKPLSELKAGGYVTRNGIMAKGYSKGGDPGDGHGGGMSEPVEDLEPEEVEEEKPTDPYEGYTYVKGIGYVPTSRRATSNKPIESASLALSSIFTPGFLNTIGLMGDPNEEL